MDRRDFFKIAAAVIGTSLLASKSVFAKEEHDKLVKELLGGNARYLDNKEIPETTSVDKRKGLAKGQKPFAVIVACSDSRVSPEIVFDKDLGELFIVRTAGNIVDSVALGSVEYAVEHLHSPLVIVCGHEGCGAVKATIESHGHAEGNIGAIVKIIAPSVEKARKATKDESQLLTNAIKENVRSVVEAIKKSPVVHELVHKGEVEVKGAYYSITDGTVTII